MVDLTSLLDDDNLLRTVFLSICYIISMDGNTLHGFFFHSHENIKSWRTGEDLSEDCCQSTMYFLFFTKVAPSKLELCSGRNTEKEHLKSFAEKRNKRH